MIKNSVSRRAILMGSASLAALPKEKAEQVHVFTTADYEIRLTFEFHDNQGQRGLNFLDRSSDHRFCLSFSGKEDRNCVDNFMGSIAVARYRMLSHAAAGPSLSLREYVRSIDRSESLPERPPFERVIQLQHGLASDIQVFGYDNTSTRDSLQAAETDAVWCLLRQDLYLQGKATPFLVVHWKHTLNAIRVLDMIPGHGTVELQTAGKGK